MWGDPHISVGRRVERPIQCRKVAEGSQGDCPSRLRLCRGGGIHKTEAGGWKLSSCCPGSFHTGADCPKDSEGARIRRDPKRPIQGLNAVPGAPLRKAPSEAAAKLKAPCFGFVDLRSRLDAYSKLALRSLQSDVPCRLRGAKKSDRCRTWCTTSSR